MKITIEINNNYGKIVDRLSVDQLKIIQDECSFRMEGSEYKSMQYAKRRIEWDGRKKLFNTQTRRFPIGLLSRVMELFSTFGIEVNIINKRNIRECPIDVSIVSSDKTIRDYQSDAVLQSVINGNGIVKVATGGGKTAIAGFTINAFKRRSIFIVHTRDLLYQAKDSFAEMFGVEIGQIGDGILDYKDITVATMQTLAILGSIEVGKNKYDEESDTTEEAIEITHTKVENFQKYKQTVQCVMMDEVQIVCSQTAFGVRFLFENANIAFGYSASPWRDDGSELMIEAGFGKRIVDISASELILKGYLVKPTIHVKNTYYTCDDIKGDYVKIYTRYIVENIARNMQVVEEAMHWHGRMMNTLILVTQIKHGDMLQSMLSQRGVNAVFISGKSGMKKRRKAIEDMCSGNISLMIATSIADVGLDIPRLECIVEAGAGKSSVTALQRLGRIMRPFVGKDECHFITFRDTAPFVGSHIDKKLEIWRTESEFNIVEDRVW